MKIRPVGAQFFHSDVWKDRETRRSYRRFSQFCKRASNGDMNKTKEPKANDKRKSRMQADLQNWPNVEKLLTVLSHNICIRPN